jgi:HlyD family secretion protein
MIEAQASLENLQAGPSQEAIASAQAVVDKAQADYDRAQAGGPTQDEINAAQSDINQARAELDRLNKGGNPNDIQVAQAEVDKYTQEVQALSKGASATDLAQAQGELDQATAQVKQAQLKIGQLNLLAPFNSVVESINVSPGQAVAPGPVAITLVDLSKPSFEARVNESSIQRIKQGQAVRITFEGIRGVRSDPFKGKVTLISTSLKNSTTGGSTQDSRNLNTPAPVIGVNSLNTPAADQSGFPVTILLDQDNELTSLKPGMSGRARFVLGNKPDALLVPKIAIRSLEVGPVVDGIIPDGLVVATPVTLGLIGDDYVEILDSGLLREGDKIVLYGTAPVPAVSTPPQDTTGPNPTAPATGGATTGEPVTTTTPAATTATGTPGSISASPGGSEGTPVSTGVSPAATPIIVATPGGPLVAGPPAPVLSVAPSATAARPPTPSPSGPTPTPRG